MKFFSFHFNLKNILLEPNQNNTCLNDPNESMCECQSQQAKCVDCYKFKKDDPVVYLPFDDKDIESTKCKTMDIYKPYNFNDVNLGEYNFYIFILYKLTIDLIQCEFYFSLQ